MEQVLSGLEARMGDRGEWRKVSAVKPGPAHRHDEMDGARELIDTEGEGLPVTYVRDTST